MYFRLSKSSGLGRDKYNYGKKSKVFLRLKTVTLRACPKILELDGEKSSIYLPALKVTSD